MAVFKHLLSHGHRLSNPPPPPPPPPPRHLVSLLRRHFSSEPQSTSPPDPIPQPSTNFRNPVPLQPVSYPTKPKASPPEETQPERPPERQFHQSEARDEMRFNNNENPNLGKRSWNADDMPYMKNESPVTPVSYAARVAPLPEDRANAGGGMNVEMAEERRRFEGYKRRGYL